jgi:hypothetical protein
MRTFTAALGSLALGVLILHSHPPLSAPQSSDAIDSGTSSLQGGFSQASYRAMVPLPITIEYTRGNVVFRVVLPHTFSRPWSSFAGSTNLADMIVQVAAGLHCRRACRRDLRGAATNMREIHLNGLLGANRCCWVEQREGWRTEKGTKTRNV